MAASAGRTSGTRVGIVAKSHLRAATTHLVDIAGWLHTRGVQAVFQNPYSALNPRMRVREIVGEPLIAEGGLAKTEIAERVREKLRGARVAGANA